MLPKDKQIIDTAVLAFHELNAAAIATRRKAAHTLFHLADHLGQKPIIQPNVANVARQLPRKFHDMLMDEDPHMAWIGALALFGGKDHGQDPATPIVVGYAQKAALLAAAQDYVIDQKVGLITTLSGRRLNPVGEDKGRFEIELEVADRLSLEHQGQTVKTWRPDWAADAGTLAPLVWIRPAENRVVTWETTAMHAVAPRRGLTAMRIEGAAQAKGADMIALQASLNGHLLFYNNLTLSDLPTLKTIASMARRERDYDPQPAKAPRRLMQLAV